MILNCVASNLETITHTNDRVSLQVVEWGIIIHNCGIVRKEGRPVAIQLPNGKRGDCLCCHVDFANGETWTAFQRAGLAAVQRFGLIAAEGAAAYRGNKRFTARQ